MNNEDTLPQDATAIAEALELSRSNTERPAGVPGFTVIRLLGEGAYGSVWLAREENTGKQVAIKFYTHHRGLDWSLLNREVEKLAVLYTSRNIVRLLGVGWDADPPYYVMEYLANGSLAGFLSQGPVPPHEAVRIAQAVARALVHAHGSGILHCDLKPANILLDADFEPRICDFGQSRLSNEQSPALGTLFYMAPEQAHLDAIPDARWDVYALGALLYYMLRGRAPYWTAAREAEIRETESLEGRLTVYREILKTSDRPTDHRSVSGVDKRLAEIVDRCLQIDPRKRFPNAQAALDTMELRARQRARRPLVALGIVGPGLLLLAMAFVVGNVLKKSVDNARATLIDRALESDVQPARILAQSLAPKLVDRERELADIAENSDLQLKTAVRNSHGLSWEERKGLFSELEGKKLDVDAKRKDADRPTDLSWFVTDGTGKQLWRAPYSDKTVDNTYNWRDYFHGRGREFSPESVPADIGPIREAHVSLAFRSKATGELMLAISAPIWNVDKDEVIGVLARTLLLNDLLEDFGYGEGIRGGSDVDRVVALVQCIDGTVINHPGLTDKRMASLTDEQFQQLTLGEPVAANVKQLLDSGADPAAGQDDVRAKQYVDPVGHPSIDPESLYGGEWLAAFVLVEGTGWATVVQERRESALLPIARMQEEMLRYALGALVAGCTLVGLLWYFVFRGLTDRSVRGWAKRSVSNQSLERNSSVSDR